MRPTFPYRTLPTIPNDRIIGIDEHLHDAIMRAASNRIQAFHLRSRSATGDVAGCLGEVFGAVQVINVANAETHAI